MESRAKFLGHPLHQMMVVFPLGLLATSVLFDIAGALTNNPELYRVAYWLIMVGVVTGLLAAVPGWIDWAHIPSGTRAKRIGLVHGLGNTVVLAAFGFSEWLRYGSDPSAPATAAVVLSFLGVALALFTAWLGGELVDRLGVGVDPGANLNAPSSLSGLSATETSEPITGDAPLPAQR
jgi:Predicted membrane protein